MTAISSLSELSPEQQAALAASLRSGEYNLFLGAGVSLDATNSRNQRLPSGSMLKLDLCKVTGAGQSSSLQRVFSDLNENQIRDLITERFVNCSYGPSLENIPSFLWRRIFTLNIDDALESVYDGPIKLQEKRPFHFRDTYEEMRTLEQVPIVHLHGWARQPDKKYVFAIAEYARMMADSNAWMTVLADIMPVEPFIIAGTSLEEADLEYYLARRSSISFRDDRGPSFRIEPYPDGQTERDCERKGLLLYVGDFQKFCRDLDGLVPNRTGPYELTDSNTRNIFPEESPKNVVLSFVTDFDRIPSRVTPSTDPGKFSFGSPPSWPDLAGNWDVGRPLTRRIRSAAEAMLQGKLPKEVIVILDHTGVGKTTILRRVGFDLAGGRAIVLNCTALSRVDPRTTAEAIDLIDSPLVFIVDDFAEQASAIAQIINLIEKKDVLFVGADRSYRQRHVVRAFGDNKYRLVDGLTLSRAEARQLIAKYVIRGQAGSSDATKKPDQMAMALEREPIAVACCHILNDMRPLDSIVKSTYSAATEVERKRYLMSALAHYCFGGGVRYEILAGTIGRQDWSLQFRPEHPLPLEYVDQDRNFIIPLNTTLAERTLARADMETIYSTFEGLAHGIAPRVNRNAVRRRTPEARLAGRLFDYDDVVSKFLGEQAGSFYSKMQKAWQWNSRYWEQVALYQLARYRIERDQSFLQRALQHARHAVSIEDHPYPLTTLGKVLIAHIGVDGMSDTAVYAEVYDILIRAIDMERRRARASVHAYVTLFSGTLQYLQRGRPLSAKQHSNLQDLTLDAQRYFPGDKELRGIAEELRAVL